MASDPRPSSTVYRTVVQLAGAGERVAVRLAVVPERHDLQPDERQDREVAEREDEREEPEPRCEPFEPHAEPTRGGRDGPGRHVSLRPQTGRARRRDELAGVVEELDRRAA